MPNKFYHILLVSGKDIYLNPDHVVFASHDKKNDEWEATVNGGFVFNFKTYGGYDNVSLASRIASRLPA